MLVDLLVIGKGLLAVDAFILYAFLRVSFRRQIGLEPFPTVLAVSHHAVLVQ